MDSRFTDIHPNLKGVKEIVNDDYLLEPSLKELIFRYYYENFIKEVALELTQKYIEKWVEKEKQLSNNSN